ncbi:MAG TPA: DUF881 domain-containing protein [Marmoricola sp.]|nr:DUF881 domain-containing protein [Marmoricola sp.]HNO39900.1 DUF881 domain-containing protein [Marmoricola sp.]
MTEHRPPRPTGRAWRVAAIGMFAAGGMLFVTSAVNAKGLDLRASSVTDTVTLVKQERARVDSLQERITTLNHDIDVLVKQNQTNDVRRQRRGLRTLQAQANFSAVSGSGVIVTLDDAPKEVRERAVADGTPPVEELIVHQQDIQAVVNAMWSGGAEAVSIQGQRVIATTGIKCVGNTVRLHGQTYAPPYVIKAVGPVSDLEQALDESADVQAYISYADDYQLGWELLSTSRIDMPPYRGSVELHYARPLSGTGEQERPGS